MRREKNGSEMNNIHPTAIVSPRALLGKNNYIGPYCVVYDNVIMGNDNTFTSHVSVGSPAEHNNDKYNPMVMAQPDCFVYIGNGNTFREFVTINMPTESKRTIIGDSCYIMKNSHISHDTTLENNVTMSCGVLLGGYTYVMNGAVLGLGSITHQRSLIGSYSMLGMNCVVNKSSNIEPFNVYIGNPAKYLKENIVGIERAGLDETFMRTEKDRYKFKRGLI